MRVHHKIPSIFNLSMVDVLCCALGCVILLWLYYLREAEENQREHSAILATLNEERDQATRDVRDLRARLVRRQAEAIDLDKRLKEALARLLAVETDLDLNKKKGKEEL